MLSLEGYTKAEEKRVLYTIATLRKMRCAGEVAEIKGLDPQEILKDAETLAKAPASYIVHLLEGAQTSEMSQLWDETLKSLDAKYSQYPMIRRSPFSIPLMDVRTKLLVMTFLDPDEMTKYFISGNGLGNITFKNMFDDSLGILAPLSTDILSAFLLPEYIKRHYSDRTPVIKPALIWADLTKSILPKDEQGIPVFVGMSRVLAFVDMDAVGETRKALYKFAEQEYPGKVIKTGYY